MTAVLVAVVVVLATGCASSIYQASFINRDSQDAIEGEYLVVLKGHLTEEKVAAHIDHVRTQALLEYRYAKKQESDIYGAVEEDDVDAYPKRMQPDVIMTTFSVGDIKGYGARLSDRLRDNLRRMKEVKYIEQNIIGRAESCKIRRNAEWGLVRTTVQTILGKGKKYDYKWDSDGAGKGVVIYVIDSGIYTDHEDFEGRAKWGYDFVKNKEQGEDLSGHGTHVAGIIMSETYGIANEATAIAVRVLDKNEITTTMRAVQGLEWAIKHHDQRPENVKKSIINLSISTSRQSHAINDLVTKATDKNIYVVSAAGNIDRSKDEQCKDACSSSPGSARTSITVMASDEDEKFASFNKYGDCAHIIAPGHNIVSTYIGSNRRATYTLSGTSVAAPHVSGVIAKYISSLSVLPTPIKLRDELVFNATKDIIVDLPADMEHSAVIYYPAPKICSP